MCSVATAQSRAQLPAASRARTTKLTTFRGVHFFLFTTRCSACHSTRVVVYYLDLSLIIDNHKKSKELFIWWSLSISDLFTFIFLFLFFYFYMNFNLWSKGKKKFWLGNFANFWPGRSGYRNQRIFFLGLTANIKYLGNP